MLNIKHKIYVRRKSRSTGDKEATPLIKRCIRMVLHNEGITIPCEINVYLTDDAEIRQLNLEHRGIDAATDVLSFPMLDLEPGEFSYTESDLDPETGRLVLGDMSISVERAAQQASGNGNSELQEVAYLAIHSALHMLGYDHEDDADYAKMREREEAVAAMMRTVLD